MLWMGIFVVIWVVSYLAIPLTYGNVPAPAESWASLILCLITARFLHELLFWGKPAWYGLISNAPITVSELSFEPLRRLVITQLLAGAINFLWIIVFWSIYHSPYQTLAQTPWWIYGGNIFCISLLSVTLINFWIFLLLVRRFRKVADADSRCHVFYSLAGTGAWSVVGVFLIFYYYTTTAPDDLFLIFTLLHCLLLIIAEILFAGLYYNLSSDRLTGYREYGFGLGCGNHVPFKRWVAIGFFRHTLIVAIFVLYIWLFRSVFVIIIKLGG